MNRGDVYRVVDGVVVDDDGVVGVVCGRRCRWDGRATWKADAFSIRRRQYDMDTMEYFILVYLDLVF